MKAIIDIIKENRIKTIIISLLIIVLIFSVSYAAFFKTVESDVKTGKIGTLDVTYTDGENLNLVNTLPLLDEEVMEYAPSYDFEVKNTGDVLAFAEISLTNLVIDNTLKSDENFRWAFYEDTTKLSEGNFQKVETVLSLKKNISIPVGTSKIYTLKIWLKDNGNDQNYLLNKKMTGKIKVSVASTSVATTFDYSGIIETYTISESGTYKIEAAGASGTIGNTYSFGDTPPVGGKGATISSTFNLKSGDILYIVAGGKGSSTQANDTDGTSGAGGGGSFVFKKISSITNNTYQFQKGSDYYEVLLVAAGGGGSNDASELGIATNGSDGLGDTWVTPGGAAYSTEAINSNSSKVVGTVLGISQFISYDLRGTMFTRNGGVCIGGFGGGSCSNMESSYGGGWHDNGNRTASSFSSGTNTSGTTGTRSGNGYVKIYKD